MDALLSELSADFFTILDAVTIAQLKALRRNERQMNRQFELALEIRRLERELGG